jgi:hypothetical protein
MKSKLRRKLDGPGWVEVIFGAALSLLLGVLFAVAFLVFKPVTTVKELPKEPEKNMVYFIEGSRETSKTRQVTTKQRQMAQGQSVLLNHDELNTLVIPPKVPRDPKNLELAQEEASDQAITPGVPNFRIEEGVMQIGVPVTLKAYDTEHQIILQTRGGFAKVGDTVVFQPKELYVGSCPLERLPAVRDFVIKQIFAKAKLPDEVVALWQNVDEATIEGSMLRLTAR